MNTTDPQRTPRKLCPSRREYRRRRPKYALSNRDLGRDYTMDRTWMKSLLDMFYNHSCLRRLVSGIPLFVEIATMHRYLEIENTTFMGDAIPCFDT